MSEPGIISVRAIVVGRVQRVGFRGFIAKAAMNLNLSGWVRNREDGSVEFEAHGDQMLIDELLKVARKGPFIARVESLETEQIKTPVEFDEGFRIAD